MWTAPSYQFANLDLLGKKQAAATPASPVHSKR
jgi:hypothetical protein